MATQSLHNTPGCQVARVQCPNPQWPSTDDDIKGQVTDGFDGTLLQRRRNCSGRKQRHKRSSGGIVSRQLRLSAQQHARPL